MGTAQIGFVMIFLFKPCDAPDDEFALVVDAFGGKADTPRGSVLV